VQQYSNANAALQHQFNCFLAGQQVPAIAHFLNYFFVIIWSTTKKLISKWAKTCNLWKNIFVHENTNMFQIWYDKNGDESTSYDRRSTISSVDLISR